MKLNACGLLHKRAPADPSLPSSLPGAKERRRRTRRRIENLGQKRGEESEAEGRERPSRCFSLSLFSPSLHSFFFIANSLRPVPFVLFFSKLSAQLKERLVMSARGVAGLGNAQVSGRRPQWGGRKRGQSERERTRGFGDETSDDCGSFLRRRSSALSCPGVPHSSVQGVSSDLLR